MTVTKDSSLLCSFKLKIDEAVSYVPKMPISEKVKAVQFWNVVSEKLQDIVNSNAAAFSAAAVKPAENDLDKVHIDVNNSRSVNASNCNISSDFINLSSNYSLSNELIEQYQSVDINNTQLLTSEAFSIVTESSLNSIANTSELNSPNSSMNSCDRSIAANNFVEIESLPENESAIKPIKTNVDYVLKALARGEPVEIYETLTDSREISENSYSENDTTLVSLNTVSTKEEESAEENNKNISILKRALKEKSFYKLNSELSCDDEEEDNDSDGSEISNVSVKSEFDITKGDLSSGSTEQGGNIISFVVSSTEEILARNLFKSKMSDAGKKCPSNCGEPNCSHVRRYTCPDCSAKFATKSNLMVHVRKHTGEKPFSCSKCTSSFSTKGNLVRHLKSHTGVKPFQCLHCGGKFTEKKSLKIHMRRHTGEKPYECKECGKRFAQTGILRTHMAMHLDKKCHVCEQCGKAFRQKAQLQVHELRHKKIKRHSCSLCDYQFLTKGDLDRHKRVHTGERPFACKICSKTFTRQQSLNEHINRHYGLRPYVCKYCSRAFTELSGCNKHMKLHEKKNC